MTPIARRSFARMLSLLLPVVLAGCVAEPPIDVSRPEGFATDEQGRWWIPGIDTSVAFRDLSSLPGMGLARSQPVYSVGQALADRRDVGRMAMLESIRRRLLPLYRNHPEVVDSLFWRHVADALTPSGEATEDEARLDAHTREAYRRIMRHFRAPAPLKRLGVDVTVDLPDSLRDVAAGRSVTFQILVDTSGSPAALGQLRGIHPIVDRIALRATTQMRWQPAYLLRGGHSDPIESWVRFGVRFPGAPVDSTDA